MTKKCYQHIILLLCICNACLIGVIYFFTCEVGLVRVTTEFDTGYDFFYKKKDMHRIFYIEPVGERDLNQLSEEAFNDLLEFCSAAREDTSIYKVSCGAELVKEISRRELLKK